jgi:hypothetical protein
MILMFLDQATNELRYHCNVIVHKCEQVALAGHRTCVLGTRSTHVWLSEILQPGTLETLADLSCAVTGAVVGHHYFVAVCRVGLPGKGIQSALKRSRSIVGSNDDADEHLTHKLRALPKRPLAKSNIAHNKASR